MDVHFAPGISVRLSAQLPGEFFESGGVVDWCGSTRACGFSAEAALLYVEIIFWPCPDSYL